MSQNPSFKQLKEFIKKNPKATICEIRDKFNKQGSSVCSVKDPNSNKELVLAYAIDRHFWTYLQNFMKEDYVICSPDMMACLISDKTRYTGPGEFVPITLSINSDDGIDL
jgi:hypothetical protein